LAYFVQEGSGGKAQTSSAPGGNARQQIKLNLSLQDLLGSNWVKVKQCCANLLEKHDLPLAEELRADATQNHPHLVTSPPPYYSTTLVDDADICSARLSFSLSFHTASAYDAPVNREHGKNPATGTPNRTALPEESVDLAFTCPTTHWISREMMIKYELKLQNTCCVHLEGASREELASFRKASMEDGVAFLLARAIELKPGGKLFMNNAVSTNREVGKTTWDKIEKDSK
jgi:hypothetical protein